MRTVFRFAALCCALLLALVAAGCSAFGGGGMIRVSEIEGPVERITQRHDAYVNVDPTLDHLHQREYLRQSQLLRDVVAAAKGTNPTTAPSPASQPSR